MTLSVIIITKNEENAIRDCLESVKWATEIIVLDSGSTDGTVAICKQYTDKVFTTDWPGFGIQKNRALNKATQDWVLCIDADERVPESLRKEIIIALKQTRCDGYLIPRLSYYCGKAIQYSGWRPDYCLRLVKRDKAQFSHDKIHERMIVKGSSGKLKNSLIHYSFDNLRAVVEKMNLYSELAAQQLYEQGKTATIKKAIFHGLWTFLRTYFFRAGFLDGKQGFLLAISNAEGSYYKYAKLALMSRNSQRF